MQNIPNTPSSTRRWDYYNWVMRVELSCLNWCLLCFEDDLSPLQLNLKSHSHCASVPCMDQGSCLTPMHSSRVSLQKMMLWVGMGDVSHTDLSLHPVSIPWLLWRSMSCECSMACSMVSKAEHDPKQMQDSTEKQGQTPRAFSTFSLPA